jgi:P-type conjugative transfer ATPase TrbB
MNYELEEESRVTAKLKSELGPEVGALLDDPLVTDIMLNPDGRLWVAKLGEEKKEFGTMSADRAESLMGTVAAYLDKEINKENPILDAELPFNGSRFAAALPPIVAGPTFCIRKKAIRVFSLADYVEQGIMTEAQREAISEAVIEKENILIVGGTGTGKTTLANAVIRHIAEVSPKERIVILEDTWELQCAAADKVQMRSSDNVSMTMLLKRALRFNFDRIVVGEVRDGAALDLLDSWNTGHPGGVATLHANSARSIFTRLERLVSLASTAPMQGLIVEAVNLIIYIQKHDGGRRIKEIYRVTGHDGKNYLTESIGSGDTK